MPEDKQTIGGANFSEISGSELHTGDIDASVHAGGDVLVIYLLDAKVFVNKSLYYLLSPLPRGW